MLCSPLAADYAAPQAETEQRQREDHCPSADQAANTPQDRPEKAHNGQTDVAQGTASPISLSPRPRVTVSPPPRVPHHSRQVGFVQGGAGGEAEAMLKQGGSHVAAHDLAAERRDSKEL